MSGRQTYNEEEKRYRNLSTCLYFKVTEQMTTVFSTSIQYPVKKQAANFSLFLIWAKSASYDQFYRFYEELIWTSWKAAQNEKRYFKFICYILEDLIKISLFWQLNEYRKSMTDGILPLRSWLSIPQSLSRSKHNENRAINKCSDQQHHHGRR